MVVWTIFNGELVRITFSALGVELLSSGEDRLGAQIIDNALVTTTRAESLTASSRAIIVY